jgi:ArsR family transcriptional regulator, lead/cadmium/zinc/bismuth-responsive transcriptional repressor
MSVCSYIQVNRPDAMTKSPTPLDTTPGTSQTSSVATTAELCDVRHTNAEAVGPIRRALVSERAAEALAATFSVLGDPTRVRLLDALAQQEMCVCELAEIVNSSESAVSHQLRLLRSLRLVRSRRSGRLVFYRLDDEHIRRLLDQGRRHIEEETEYARPEGAAEKPAEVA